MAKKRSNMRKPIQFLFNALLAIKFFLLSGPLFCARGQNTTTNQTLTPEQQAAIFIDDLSVMKGFMWPVVPPNYSAWVKLWNEVKAA